MVVQQRCCGTPPQVPCDVCKFHLKHKSVTAKVIQRSPACTGELPEGAKTSRVFSLKTVVSARRVLFSNNTSTHTQKSFAKLSLTAVRVQWSHRRGACPVLEDLNALPELSAVHSVESVTLLP